MQTFDQSMSEFTTPMQGNHHHQPDQEKLSNRNEPNIV